MMYKKPYTLAVAVRNCSVGTISRDVTDFQSLFLVGAFS